MELICDRVAILAGGKVRGIGTPAELTQQFHGALTAKLRIEFFGQKHQIEQLQSELTAHATEHQCEALPEERWQFSTHIESQADVDRLVDQARRHGIGIYKLQRTQLTLEEVFLSAVQDET